MISMLVAYDAAGDVIATLDYCVARNPQGQPIGVIDFDAHESAGGEHLDIWRVSGAAGSKTWPEWLGGRAHDFTVELVGPPGRKRLTALVHKRSGVRRERSQIEARIQERIAASRGAAADLRDLVGGPDKPLPLDDDGNAVRRVQPTGSPAGLPLVQAQVAPGRSDSANARN